MLHRIATAILFAVAMLTMACAVPFGPSYTIERQQILVTFAPQTPGRVVSGQRSAAPDGAGRRVAG